MRLEALPHLDKLAHEMGERANLGILHRNELLYLAGVEKPGLPTIYSRFGKTAPAYCSSLGKAILAHLPGSMLDVYFAEVPLESRTENTITDEATLRKELAEARRQGYAVDREEHIPGLYCISSAIIVDGTPIGSIGVTARSLEPLLENIETIQHTAEVISHVLNRGA
jgi:IclR family acetate operon transcriptional repressor